MPTVASHLASPSAGPGPGSPAGRSGGWSAPVPGEEDRWESERAFAGSPPASSSLGGVFTVYAGWTGSGNVQGLWAVTEDPGLVSSGIKTKVWTSLFR